LLRNPIQFTPKKHPIHNRILPARQSYGGRLNADLEITPNLEPLFGTRDENLRLMEDSLGVRIDLRSDAVHVEGPDEAVGRVKRIFQDFEALRRQGVNPHNGELNGMLRLVVADPATTLRSLVD
jgi:phosphate starvation-inducible protein PhoH and related proteins